jgi:hypothetical protein
MALFSSDGRVELTGKRKKVWKLTDNFKGKMAYWELKEETLDDTLRGTRFGKVRDLS